jgi:putative ATP-binding cassette transporter
VNTHKTTIRGQNLRRLFETIGSLIKSPIGGKACLLLAVLLILMLGINGLNVVNSYVGRYFMSAIEKRDSVGFVRFAWLYVAVFAGSTLVGVLFRFTEEHLGLLWREWLTRRVTGAYIERRLYLCLGREDTLSNPDQRITEDIRQLTTTTLSFVLMMLNGTLTVFSFSGVLWAISPKLFMIAVLYALAGSGLAIWLGRPLIRLNYRQSDFEANFRTELIHTREDAEKIAASGAEPAVRDRLNRHIDNLVSNLRHIIAVNRNLNFFTSGYNYFIQLIPVLIVAPLFIQRQVEFGVIGQSAMAFATLLGAFSLVITQFQAISSYATVVARLNELGEHADRCEIKYPRV